MITVKHQKLIVNNTEESKTYRVIGKVDCISVKTGDIITGCNNSQIYSFSKTRFVSFSYESLMGNLEVEEVDLNIEVLKKT